MLILEESISRYHAVIHFNTIDLNFYLQDVKSTTGTFLKIEQPLELRQDMIFELGSNQFLVNAINASQCYLELIVSEGQYIGNEYVLDFSQKSTPQSIGRKGNNAIQMPDDHHMSGIHSSINFIENKFYLEDLSSTNG